MNLRLPNEARELPIEARALPNEARAQSMVDSIASTRARALDEFIEAYKAGIDRSLIRDHLRLSPEERVRRLQQLQGFAEELRRAGRDLRRNGR